MELLSQDLAYITDFFKINQNEMKWNWTELGLIKSFTHSVITENRDETERCYF